MRVLVIGEVCKDRFVYCKCDRMCPEGPVPVAVPIYENCNLGMAGNVWENMKALGVDAEFMSNESNTIKTRFIDEKSNQLLLRFDEKDISSRIVHRNDYDDFDMIVISDYNKGFLSQNDINKIAKENMNVILDTKKVLDWQWCRHLKYIKINASEFEESNRAGGNTGSLSDRLIVTLGRDGCRFNDKIYPVARKLNTIDISGAGDTFLAGFAVGLIKYGSPESAIEFAQKCTAVVVQKAGVAVANLKEVEEII